MHRTSVSSIFDLFKCLLLLLTIFYNISTLFTHQNLPPLVSFGFYVELQQDEQTVILRSKNVRVINRAPCSGCDFHLIPERSIRLLSRLILCHLHQLGANSAHPSGKTKAGVWPHVTRTSTGVILDHVEPINDLAPTSVPKSHIFKAYCSFTMLLSCFYMMAKLNPTALVTS